MPYRHWWYRVSEWHLLQGMTCGCTWVSLFEVLRCSATCSDLWLFLQTYSGYKNISESFHPTEVLFGEVSFVVALHTWISLSLCTLGSTAGKLQLKKYKAYWIVLVLKNLVWFFFFFVSLHIRKVAPETGVRSRGGKCGYHMQQPKWKVSISVLMLKSANVQGD